MASNIRFEGISEIMDRLDKVANPEKYRQAIGQACAVVEAAAKQNAPKGDTGELRRSITSEVVIDGNSIAGVVYTPLEYAPYVELGTGLFAEEGGRLDVPWCYQDDKGEWHTTSGQHPHPFLRPALLENREKIVRILKEGREND